MGRQEIFDKVTAALGNKRDSGQKVTVPLSHADEEGASDDKEAADDKVELFVERVTDYKAVVVRAAHDEEVATLVATFLHEALASSVVVPPGLAEKWCAKAKAEGVSVLCDDPPLSKETLDDTSAVITAAAAGIAQTGTIVLDHRLDQGRRIISLLPDTHICIIREDQVVFGVSEAMARLEPSIHEGQPITWISGPSATVDIELIRVEGVHGPRNLYVIIVS